MIHKIIALTLAFCLFNLQLSITRPSNAGTASWIKVELVNSAQASDSTSTFKPQKIDTADYISLITMLVLAVAATSMLVTCKKGANIDVYLFSAAALAYIMGEIAVNLSYKKINTKAIEYNNNGNLTDKQYRSLVDLKNSYKDVKGSAETKRTLQLAAGAAMLAAAAVATAAYIRGKTLKATCEATLSEAAAAAPEVCPVYGVACAAAAIDAVGEKIIAEAMQMAVGPSLLQTGEVTAADASADAAAAAGCAECPQAIAPAQPACALDTAFEIGSSVSCVPFAFRPHFLPIHGEKQWLAKALNLVIPVAKADDLIGMLGIGAVGIGIVVGLLIAKKTFIDNLVAYPGKRALLFAAAGAIAMATSLTTNNIIKSCKSNIEKIDKILNQYANYDSSASAQGGKITGGVTTSSTDAYRNGLPFSLPDNQKFDCVGDKKKDGSCASLSAMFKDWQKTNSDKAKGSELDSLSSVTIDPSVASLTSNMMAATDEIQGTGKLSEGALSKYAAAAAQQNAAQDSLSKYRKNLNDLLKDTGGKPVDFAAQEKELQNQLRQSTLTSLQEQGKSLDDLLKEGVLASPLINQSTQTDPAQIKTTGALAAVDLKKFKNERKASRASSLPAAPAAATQSSAEAAVEYEYENEMIRPEDGHTLWEVLTNRYQNSGYDRLFPGKK